MSDEHRLIAQLRTGHRASHEYVVRAYGGSMLATSRRLVQDEEDARDCVQDAFLQAFRNIHDFEGRSALGTWLHRIVINAALAKIRVRDRRREISMDELAVDNLLPKFDRDGNRVDPGIGAAASIERLLERRETRDIVRRSIDQLPEIYRTVLMLRDIEEYDTQETAALLGLSPATVKVRLHRARSALKKVLEPVMLEGRC